MISVAPIADKDLFDATLFMHEQLNRAIPHDAWISAFRHRWSAEKPNNGFMLKDEDRIVGVLGAIYSEQMAGGSRQRFCNLTSLCLLPQYRGRTLDLLAKCLGQTEYNFTNFTPNSSVEKICGLLKFRKLAQGEYILPHLPLPLATTGLRVVTGDHAEEVLPVEVARVYRDHCTLSWLSSLIIGRGEQYCLVFYKRAPIRRFATAAAAIVHVSDPELFLRYSLPIGGHLLLRHGILASRIDRRLLHAAPRFAVERPDRQARLYRGRTLDDTEISNLYSELVALPM
jgi:hypothetical protein